MTFLAFLKVKKAPAIAFALLLPLLLSLGSWQLRRADEKQMLLDLQASRSSEQPYELSTAHSTLTDDLLYKPVRVIGHFDDAHQILQNNQIRNGKAGYFVLTPFLMTTNKAILVNRGWLAEKAARSVLSGNLPSGSLEVRGVIGSFSRPGLVLAGADKPTEGWPSTVQVVNTSVLANKLGYELFGYQIELDQSYAYGFSREWRHPQTMPPEKHRAYAVQWFLLALTLSVMFIRYGFEKNNVESES